MCRMESELDSRRISRLLRVFQNSRSWFHGARCNSTAMPRPPSGVPGLRRARRDLSIDILDDFSPPEVNPIGRAPSNWSASLFRQEKEIGYDLKNKSCLDCQVVARHTAWTQISRVYLELSPLRTFPWSITPLKVGRFGIGLQFWIRLEQPFSKI